ncbi:MAG: hypothetical protein J0M33_19880 [Anaerolineae bacterium]|nr:hypothetical protein [Anaerolineae bacterium]
MRKTVKYLAGCQLAKTLGKRSFKDNDALNAFLDEQGYQWNSRAGEWEKKPEGEIRAGVPGLFRVRVHGNQDEIGDFVDGLVAHLKSVGGTVQEISDFYPNVRRPGDTGGRIYITLMME